MSNGLMTIVLYGDGNRTTYDNAINDHSIHIWDKLNITVFWEMSYKPYVEKYIKIY